MNTKTYHGEYTLRHWINLMLKRNIVLPDYQRSFVWSNQDVERLIHSFMTGQFIQPVTIARMNVSGNGTNLILDGQQRLTSILLFVLGIYPIKDKFTSTQTVASEDDSASSEEGDNYVENAIIGWTFEDLLQKEIAENTISRINSRNASNDKYTTLNLRNPVYSLSGKDMDEFLDNTFLGFSYIVPDVMDADAEQKYFSTLFRNMNYLGRKLSTLESRKSLYFLNKDYKNYFDGKFKDNGDALAGLKIIENIAPATIDFVRYLSILSQYDSKSASKVMVGYSAYSSRESYYVDYVSYILGLDQESRKDKFDGFDFKAAFPNNEWQDRYKVLSDTLMALKGKMELDKKNRDAFNGWIDADYWLFGLIYWIVFKGKRLDFSRDLSFAMTKEINCVKTNESYNRTPNLLMYLRDRIAKSIGLVKKYTL